MRCGKLVRGRHMGLYARKKRVFAVVECVGQPRIDVLFKQVECLFRVALVLREHDAELQAVRAVEGKQFVDCAVRVPVAVRGGEIFLPPGDGHQHHQRAERFVDVGEQLLAGQLRGLVQPFLRQMQVDAQHIGVDRLLFRQAVDERLGLVVPPEHGQRVDAQQARAQLFVFFFAFGFALFEQGKAALDQRFAGLLGVIRA